MTSPFLECHDQGTTAQTANWNVRLFEYPRKTAYMSVIIVALPVGSRVHCRLLIDPNLCV
jgi:hypothetical protein